LVADWKAQVGEVTATYPPRTGLRPCRLYRFYVTHPLTGEIVLGYVGETGRQPFERLLEHLATQPWFDTVVRWEVDPQIFYGKDAVLRAEAAAIRAERPLYNVAGNERNRHRIIPPDAIRQRRARDAQQGAARWVHPADRDAARSSVRSVPRRPLRRWQKYAIGWASAWAFTTVSCWIFALVKHLGTVGHTLAGSALVLPGMVLVAALLLEAFAKKRTRRWFWRFIFGRSR
jgi:hypothetical protein